MKAKGMMKAGYSRQRNSRSYSLKKPVAGVVPGTVRSRLSQNPGSIKVDVDEFKKHSRGGYAPVSTALDAVEQIQDLNPVVGTYHDFIHFNYGAVSQRYHKSSGSQEQELER